MKVANANIIYAAKSYNPNLLASVPPDSQVEEQPRSNPLNEFLAGKGNVKFQLPSSNTKVAKRHKKLRNRKSNKVQEKSDWNLQLSQHEKLLNIIDSQSAQRDGIFTSTTKPITESERKCIGEEMAAEVDENEKEMDKLLEEINNISSSIDTSINKIDKAEEESKVKEGVLNGTIRFRRSGH